MNPNTFPAANPVHIKANTLTRPKNLQTAYHIGLEFLAGERRLKCVALRMQGRTVRAIAKELNLSPSTVQTHITAALAEVRRLVADKGIILLKREGHRLEAIIARWHPVALDAGCSPKRAAKAAGIVAQASKDLRSLYAVPADTKLEGSPPSLTPETSETSETSAEVLASFPPPAPMQAQPVLGWSAYTITPILPPLVQACPETVNVICRALRGELPRSSFHAAWDALPDPDAYKPSEEVEAWVREHWHEFKAKRYR